VSKWLELQWMKWLSYCRTHWGAYPAASLPGCSCSFKHRTSIWVWIYI